LGRKARDHYSTPSIRTKGKGRGKKGKPQREILPDAKPDAKGRV
jgi:hypothetical protein